MVATFLSLVVYFLCTELSPLILIPSFFSSPAFMLSFLFSGSVKIIYFTVPVVFPSTTTVSLTGVDGLLSEELEEELLDVLELLEKLSVLLELEEELPEVPPSTAQDGPFDAFKVLPVL